MRPTTTVTVIPPTINPHTHTQLNSVTRRRVAAYARVSTDNEEQLTSYIAQVDYYTKYIKNKPEWDFAGVYTDEGISAVTTKHREGFKRMVNDALAGKIDLIVTKSVSRFARNTVDSLVTIRKLKEKGVEVFFEKENIFTFDSKGELLLTIICSLAQEESRNISMNVAWGQRKRFADGKVNLPYKSFLGYEKGEDGLPRIVESEAKIVRQIYRLFIEGKTSNKIAKILTEQGVPTPTGKKIWTSSTVDSILTNEKYKGSALLQKKFTVDFLTKKKKKNEGEVPQYYVENSHDAIVDPAEFEMVQEEIRRRKAGGTYNSVNILSSRVVCSECSGFYGRKIWHAGDKSERAVWQCNNKFAKRKYCSTQTLTEDAIKKAFVEAFNSLINNKEEIIQNYDTMLDIITDTSSYVKGIDVIDEKVEELNTLIEKHISTNAQSAVNRHDYEKKYNEYLKRYDTLQQQRKELSTSIDRCDSKRIQIKNFLSELMKHDTPLQTFDDMVWNAAINYIKVYNAGRVLFVFRDGTELSWTVDCEVRDHAKKKGCAAGNAEQNPLMAKAEA